MAAARATGRGFMHKKFEGKKTQLPAAFVLNPDKTIKYSYYGKHISDLPRPSELAERLEMQNNPKERRAEVLRRVHKQAVDTSHLDLPDAVDLIREDRDR